MQLKNIEDLRRHKTACIQYGVVLPKVAVVIADEGDALCHLTTLVSGYNKSSWFGVGNSTKTLNGGEMLTLNCP